MTNQEKRARQKERRAAIVAAQHAAARRRRVGQVAAALVGLGVIIGLALFAGGSGDDTGKEQEAGGQETPAGQETDGGQGSGPVACGAEAPPPADPQQYAEPEQMLEDGVDYGAVFTTSCGTVTVDLLEEEAPETTNNFVFLAKEGFYDGTTIHRVEPNKVIQGGAPEPGGAGGPGYSIQDELPKSPELYTFGTLAMANRGPNTAGSQFFFNATDPSGKQPSGYPPDYSLFGAIDPADQESVDTLVTISTLETVPGDVAPVETLYIDTIEITES